MRVNLNLPDDLIRRVDESAARLNINRTAYIAMTLSRALEDEQVIKTAPELLSALRSLSEGSFKSQEV